MAGSILGNRVLRKEDPKFLTTGGVYVDDMVDEPLLDGALHVTYVRSSVAHATITSIDASEALASPGVVAVLTAKDLDLQPIPATYNPAVARTLLASDKVRYVGEPIAVDVAAPPGTVRRLRLQSARCRSFAPALHGEAPAGMCRKATASRRTPARVRGIPGSASGSVHPIRLESMPSSRSC